MESKERNGGFHERMSGLFTEMLKGASATFDLVKARKNESFTNQLYKDGRGMGPANALMFDPNLYGFAGTVYREKPLAINYALMNHIFHRDSLIASIIIRRLNQAVTFSYPRTHEEASRTLGTGFRCIMREGNAKKRTRAVERREDEMNELIYYCADKKTPGEDRIEKSFDRFMWKFIQDRLVMDQPVAVIEESAKGGLRQFFAIDGSTVRLTEYKSKDYNRYGPYVQVFNGQVVSSFSDDQLMFCPQNLSTELSRFGYGCSELEFLVRLLIAHMGIDASNERMFNPHSMPKGILVSEQIEITTENMKQLESHWAQQMSAARSRHRIPVLGV